MPRPQATQDTAQWKTVPTHLPNMTVSAPPLPTSILYSILELYVQRSFFWRVSVGAGRLPVPSGSAAKERLFILGAVIWSRPIPLL